MWFKQDNKQKKKQRNIFKQMTNKTKSKNQKQKWETKIEPTFKKSRENNDCHMKQKETNIHKQQTQTKQTKKEQNKNNT